MTRTGTELLVTSAYTDKQFLSRLGQPAYSYRVVKAAFNSLLRRWGHDFDARDTRQGGWRRR